MWRTSIQRWQAAFTTISALLAPTPIKEERRGLATGRRRSRTAALRRNKYFRLAVDWLHALHLYGALGIAAFGSAICAVFGWDHSRWVPLWFFAALLVFNLDRALPDAADAINIPRRRSTNARLRWVSWILVLGSAAMLLWIPIGERDWWTLGMVLVGSFVCLAYPLPYLGRRLKEVPMLKTFFAPSLVVLAILALPLAHESWPRNLGVLLFTAIWAWGYLLCNMLMCDLRDIKGDRRTGVVSLPVRLGRPATYRLLWILIACTGGLAMLMAALPGSSARWIWALWSILGSGYIAGLVIALRQKRPESFYEWWVEGMLFLPAVVVAVFR